MASGEIGAGKDGQSHVSYMKSRKVQRFFIIVGVSQVYLETNEA